MRDGAEEAPDAGQAPEPILSVLEEMLGEVAALKEYAAYLASVVVDQTKLRARQAILGIVLGSIAACVFLAMAVTMAVLLLLGVDGAIASAIGRPWAGHLIVGGGGLLTIAGLVMIVKVRQEQAHRNEMVKKYEQRKRDEREQIGEDVDGASRAAA